MGEVKISKVTPRPNHESLTLKKDKMACTVKLYSGKSGDFWISIIPSLNTTGYGDSEEDSFKDLQYNLDVFSKDFFALKPGEREATLNALGWKKQRYFNKQFSNAFVDEKGVLQNFDNPLEVKSSFLETA